jgi:hypothetical protein
MLQQSAVVQPSTARLACKLLAPARDSTAAAVATMEAIIRSNPVPELCSSVLLESSALLRSTSNSIRGPSAPAAIAGMVLAQMRAAPLPISPPALQELLQLDSAAPQLRQLQLAALALHLPAATTQPQERQAAVTALPGGCLRPAALVYAQHGDGGAMLEMLQGAAACGELTHGWLRRCVEVLAKAAAASAANESLKSSWRLPLNELLRVGLVAKDAGGVEWLLRWGQSQAGVETEEEGVLLTEAVVLLLGAQREAPAAAVLQQVLQGRFGANAVQCVRWDVVAADAAKRLDAAQELELARRLMKVLRVCWEQGSGNAAVLKGRAAAAAARVELWDDALQLLDEIRDLSGEAVGHLLLGLQSLDVRGTADSLAQEFRVSSPPILSPIVQTAHAPRLAACHAATERFTRKACVG